METATAASFKVAERAAILPESTCRKCNEIFTDPRLLTCLHSFCDKCVLGMTKTVNSKSVITCVICSTVTPVPSDGIKAIPPNLYLEHEAKIALYENLIMKHPPPSCDECMRDPVVETISFCCTCMSFLCKECHNQHCLSRKLIVNHYTILLKGASDIQNQLRKNLLFTPAKCLLHMTEDIKFHCADCKELLCLRCAISQHCGHSLMDLYKFVEKMKIDVCEEVKDMPDMIGRLDELINSGTAVQNNIKAREKAIGDEVKSVFAELHQKLEAREAALLQRCSGIANDKLIILSAQLSEMTALKDAISTCTQFALRARDGFTSSEFISVVPVLNSRVNDLRKKIRETSLDLSEDDVIKFSATVSPVEKGLFMLGNIYVGCRQECTSMQDPVSSIKTTNAYHVAIHRNGDHIVANHIGDVIEVYDSNGSRKMSFGGQGILPGHFQHPLGVTIVGDILYVAEFNGGRCQKLTVNGEFMCEIGSGQIRGAWGCAVSKNGVLYVAEEGNNRVQAFSQDGKSLDVLCSAPTVYNPRDIAIDKQGKIHVAAYGSKCVKVFNPNGSFIREYGQDVLVGPSGVAVDHLGYSFVADWGGKCLQVFNPSGTNVHKISYDGCISGVTIDNNNHVYVVNHSAQVIYKY